MGRHLCVTSMILYGNITMVDCPLLGIINRTERVCQYPVAGHMQGRYIEIHHHRLLSQEFSITLIYKRVFFRRRCVIKITLCCAVLSCSVMSDSVIPWTVVCQAPLSMGILLARILEWVAMPSSKFTLSSYKCLYNDDDFVYTPYKYFLFGKNKSIKITCHLTVIKYIKA